MEYLTLDNVNMSFHSHRVLKDITLHIKKGEFISLLGPSGSGKSTLFHLIGGILQPDSGHIYLNTKEITNKRGHISYMPQTPSLFPWRTLLENVMLIQELSGKKEKEKAIAMLHKAGLSSFIHEYPSALSGGMQQRASFIRALLSEKDILLLDEPFGALDEFTRLDMQQWLLNLWEQYKRTILFITHNIEEALFLSDRIFVISKNPARIIKEVIVPFNRPRQQKLYFHQEFLQYKQELYSYLKEGFDEFYH